MQYDLYAKLCCLRTYALDFFMFPLMCLKPLSDCIYVYKFFHRLYKTMSKNKKHSVSSFQDKWLSDLDFRSWISQPKNADKARCFLCKTNFDVSVMGVSVFRSHAKGKKRQARASSSKVQSVDIRHLTKNKDNPDDSATWLV